MKNIINDNVLQDAYTKLLGMQQESKTSKKASIRCSVSNKHIVVELHIKPSTFQWTKPQNVLNAFHQGTTPPRNSTSNAWAFGYDSSIFLPKKYILFYFIKDQ
jgi:hypothetical protein